VVLKKSLRAMAGFTLLELLVVITLLAILAGGSLIAYEGVQDQGRYDAVRFEVAEIRKALLKFRRDSGTNDFPSQGIYDCTDESNGGLDTDPNSNFPLTFSTQVDIPPMSKTEFITWCQTEGNFWMLFIDPFERSETDQWNEDTRRGWNGPYLQNKYGAISNSSIDNIPNVVSPYQNPYLLIDLDNDSSAAILSVGKNGTAGSIGACNSADEDDYVACLLR